MAFDIYVGPASRYLAGDWKNIIQQVAEERGIQYHKIGPKQGLLSRVFKPSSGKVYEHWRSEVASALGAQGIPVPQWDDSPEREYATDRPGWEGYVAFVAQFAYSLHPDMSPPLRALTMPELEEDPAFSAEVEAGPSAVTALLSAQIFLPGDFRYLFFVKSLTGRQYGIACISLFGHALTQICKHKGWSRSELEGAALDQPGEDATFEQASRFGVSIVARMVSEAERNQVPLVLDF